MFKDPDNTSTRFVINVNNIRLRCGLVHCNNFLYEFLDIGSNRSIEEVFLGEHWFNTSGAPW